MLNFNDIRFDCRLYNGYKPCAYGMDCRHCKHMDRITDFPDTDLSLPSASPEKTIDQKAILIIKTGALGDVLRTTTLLPALAANFDSVPIDWVTAKNAEPLLEGNPYIRKIYTLDSHEDLEQIISQQQWTQLYCFEKTDLPLELAGKISAQQRFGFFPNAAGKPVASGKEAQYALMLGLDDELKFRENTKPYSQVIAETAGLTWNRTPYVLGLKPTHKSNTPLSVGLNTGCGEVFKTKQWTTDGWCQLANMIHDTHPQVAIHLLGGPAEEDMNRTIAQEAPFAINTGNHNSLREFASIIAQCDIIVTADTMAMHMAIALGRFVVAVFGSTSEIEIDLYDNGVYVVADAPCRPCFKKQCPHTPNGKPKCMLALNAETVYRAMESKLKAER